MTNLDKLVLLGAYSCGGDLLLGGKVVGYLRNGNLHLTDDGKQALEQGVDGAVTQTQERPRRGRARAIADGDSGVQTVDG